MIQYKEYRRLVTALHTALQEACGNKWAITKTGHDGGTFFSIDVRAMRRDAKVITLQISARGDLPIHVWKYDVDPSELTHVIAFSWENPNLVTDIVRIAREVSQEYADIYLDILAP